MSNGRTAMPNSEECHEVAHKIEHSFLVNYNVTFYSNIPSKDAADPTVKSLYAKDRICLIILKCQSFLLRNF